MEKKKLKRKIGFLHLQSTDNNTIVSISDINGNILCWSSCGSIPIKEDSKKKLTGRNKQTENAAFLAIESVCLKGLKLGIKTLSIFFKYYGVALNVFVYVIKKLGIRIRSITDMTPIAFNGCRLEKKPRKKRDNPKIDPNFDYEKAKRERKLNSESEETQQFFYN